MTLVRNYYISEADERETVKTALDEMVMAGDARKAWRGGETRYTVNLLNPGEAGMFTGDLLQVMFGRDGEFLGAREARTAPALQDEVATLEDRDFLEEFGGLLDRYC